MSTAKDIEFIQKRTPRHKEKIIEDLSGVINVSEIINFSDRNIDLVSPQETWRFLSACDAGAVTKFAGKLWQSIAASGADQLAPRPKANLQRILRLPRELCTAFSEIIGCTFVVIHPNHDWNRLRSQAILLGSSDFLCKGFIDYAKNNHGSQEVGMAMMGLISGAFTQLPEKVRLLASKRLLTFEDFSALVDRVTLIESHLNAVCDLAAGRVLCDANQLVLHYRGNGPITDAELCLSYRAPDGLLSFFPTTSSSHPPVKAVQSIRAFVESYKGPTMAGEISPHRNAMRLCSLCGLDISHGHGFLRPHRRTGSAAKGFSMSKYV